MIKKNTYLIIKIRVLLKWSIFDIEGKLNRKS